MASPFDADFAAADDLLGEVFGTAVEILGLGVDPITATAEVVLRDYHVTDQDTKLPQTIESRDYLIPLTEYALGECGVEPKRGHQIAEIINGERLVYEVMAIPGRPAVERTPDGRKWVIHTKLA